MKKIILLQTVFFILLFGIERIAYLQGNIKIILGLLLLLGLSLSMCMFLLKSNRMILESLGMGLSFWFLFELKILIEYLSGFLPRYTDVPIIFSASLALAGTLAYISILCLICLFWKRLNTKKIAM